MALAISPTEALWFLPFVVPLCLWVMWSDLSAMRIPNVAVLTLAAIFLVVGLIALPWADYPWRLLTMIVVLVLMFGANVIGVMGAGDSKFIAAAAPFIDPGDVGPLCFIEVDLPQRLPDIGRVHLIGLFIPKAWRGVQRITEGTIERGGIFGCIGEDRHLCVPRIVQSLSNGADPTIHHVAGRDDIGAGCRLGNGLFD